MNRAAVAVAIAVLLVAGCGSGHHGNSNAITTAAVCPTVGQMIDKYVNQLKAGVKDPSLDMDGCGIEQQAQRLADIQLVVDHGNAG